MNQLQHANKKYFSTSCALALLLWPVITLSENYSPYVDQTFPTEVYFGDTHLHTNLSVDSYGMGNRVLSPEDAYRFAKGEPVKAHNGDTARLSRPLDFLVVTDHGVNMGVLPRLVAGDPLLLQTDVGKRWTKSLKKYPLNTGEIVNSKSDETMDDIWTSVFDLKHLKGRAFFWKAWLTDYVKDEKFRRSVWEEVGANAERHNDPGKFTAFIGYEWTPTAVSEKAAMMHRNVIFADGSDKTDQIIPFTVQDSENVEDLWDFLKTYETKTEGQVMAIAHNGNLTNGIMFAQKNYDGKPLTAGYAETRSRWELLYEVTQIKGDGETHPVVSPTDEFADFERLYGPVDQPTSVGSADMLERRKAEYARSALMTGLDYQAKLGVNPFKFGMIGSTDAHTSLASAEENNYWGKMGLLEPGAHRLRTQWDYSSSGYAAIWATENTREALFAAMKRKETYATTGPRMTVRFFGGWDYHKDDAMKPNLAKTGYAKGVPMGGDLTHAAKDTTPSFLIRAVKDPSGANLDRVQVIKGWRDKDGELHEKIYNVALADGRQEGPDGKAPSVGSTVDIKDASYTNTIGDPELSVVWEDPDFNKSEFAFYYVRVLEIPTPRWTAYDAKYFGLKDIPQEVPMVIQERAYTSPIWYTP